MGAILPAQTIRVYCIGVRRDGSTDCPGIHRPLVSPFHERTRYRGKTFGLGPAGYDVRVAESFWLWPFWGRLASTMERFDLPDDLTFLVQDKSSWARSFVFAMNTNAEPGWDGYLTLELVRFLPWPIRIRAGDPIANIMFLRLEAPTEQPYEGKYQSQEAGPQRARWDRSETDRQGWVGRLLGRWRRPRSAPVPAPDHWDGGHPAGSVEEMSRKPRTYCSDLLFEGTRVKSPEEAALYRGHLARARDRQDARIAARQAGGIKSEKRDVEP